MKQLLKELRETRVNLRIIIEKPVATHEKLQTTRQECNELIGIFTKSIETAKANKINTTKYTIGKEKIKNDFYRW